VSGGSARRKHAGRQRDSDAQRHPVHQPGKVVTVPLISGGDQQEHAENDQPRPRVSARTANTDAQRAD
jgi:hypothetical protein